jgi:hypothetical protein
MAERVGFSVPDLAISVITKTQLHSSQRLCGLQAFCFRSLAYASVSPVNTKTVKKVSLGITCSVLSIQAVV